MLQIRLNNRRLDNIDNSGIFKTMKRQWNKLIKFSKQIVTNLFSSCRKLCSHCLFPVVVTSLEQAVNNL
jgi:hypothetical protein